MADIKMTVPPDYDTTSIEHYTIESFAFQSGAKKTIHLAFRQFNPSGTLKALIPTCYGGRINDTLNYTSGCLSDHHVVVVAMLGNGESSSPSNDADFPESLDYRDCVSAQHALVTRHLGWKELDAVIGFSMGGQQAYYWACMYPDFVKRTVPVCTSATTSAHNVAFLAGPEAALVRSADYVQWVKKKDGDRKSWPVQGLGGFGRAWCAWGFGAAWFRAGHWRDDGSKDVQEWISKNGDTSFVDWHPEDLLILLKMWQKADVGVFSQKGSSEEVLRDIKAQVLVMPSRTDAYFPPEDSEIEMKYLSHGTLKVIESVWGHIAGGGGNPKDEVFMDQEIGKFLKSSK